MKNLTLLFVVFFYTAAMQSQCITTASGFGNNNSIASYNVSGTVQVVYNTNNTVTVNLMSNFATAAGPDVRIFLIDRGNLTNVQLRNTANFLTRPRIEMGLAPASGATSFTKTIPTSINIQNLQTVYFYCQAFNQFWDFGSFTAFNAANCGTLSTPVFETTSLKIYPNPASNLLNIDLSELSNNYSLTIYNVLGSKIIEKTYNSSNSSNTIDISQLRAGIYSITVFDDQNKTYQNQFVKL